MRGDLDQPIPVQKGHGLFYRECRAMLTAVHKDLEQSPVAQSGDVVELAEPSGFDTGTETQTAGEGPSPEIRGGLMRMAVRDVFEEVRFPRSVRAEDRNTVPVPEFEVEGSDQPGEAELVASQYNVSRPAAVETQHGVFSTYLCCAGAVFRNLSRRVWAA